MICYVCDKPTNAKFYFKGRGFGYCNNHVVEVCEKVGHLIIKENEIIKNKEETSINTISDEEASDSL